MGMSEQSINKMFTGKEHVNDNECVALKNALQSFGIPVKKDEPHGNEECSCGSGIRYDMCCRKRKL